CGTRGGNPDHETEQTRGVIVPLSAAAVDTGTASGHQACNRGDGTRATLAIMRGPKRPKSDQPPSSCRCIDPIGLHEEISRDFPTCMDFLNHLQSKGAAPSQDFRRARTRAENICKLGLAVTELLDRVT